MLPEKYPSKYRYEMLRDNASATLLIYRTGAATPVNMTPRATDRNGLSAFRDAPEKPGCKYQVTDTWKLSIARPDCRCWPPDRNIAPPLPNLAYFSRI